MTVSFKGDIVLTGRERWRCYKREYREKIPLRFNTRFKLDFGTAVFFVNSRIWQLFMKQNTVHDNFFY